MADEKKPKTATETRKGLKVVAKRDGFRRAGFVFDGEPQVIALDALTKKQIEQIRGERMLVVVDVDLPPEAAAAADEGTKA